MSTLLELRRIVSILLRGMPCQARTRSFASHERGQGRSAGGRLGGLDHDIGRAQRSVLSGELLHGIVLILLPCECIITGS